MKNYPNYFLINKNSPITITIIGRMVVPTKKEGSANISLKVKAVFLLTETIVQYTPKLTSTAPVIILIIIIELLLSTIFLINDTLVSKY